MTTRSIFQKICPACMTTLSLDARDCACGHEFDHDDTDANLSSEAIRLKAEELYENYLAARSEQAAGAVMAAQAEFARDPANQDKSRRVARAIEDAEEARAALAAQSAHVAEMRKSLPPPAAPPRPAPSSKAPRRIAVSVKPVAVKPVAVPVPVRATARAANTSSVTALRAKSSANNHAAAKPARRPDPAPVVAKKKVAPLPVTAPSKTPNPAFRRAQAARAEKIMRQAETAVAVKEVIKEEIAAAPKAAPVLPAAVPALTKSAPRLMGPDMKECPNCTAMVDSKAARCRCGYEYPPSGGLMPSLSMSDDERAEFAKLFSLP